MGISKNYKHVNLWSYLAAQKNNRKKQRMEKNIPSLQVVEVVLVQRNLVDNQVSYTYIPNKSYWYFAKRWAKQFSVIENL